LSGGRDGARRAAGRALLGVAAGAGAGLALALVAKVTGGS